MPPYTLKYNSNADSEPLDSGSFVYSKLGEPAPILCEKKEVEDYLSYEDGHMIKFVPSSAIPGNYDGSILGVAFPGLNTALVSKNQNKSRMNVTKKHEKNHLENPNMNELMIRIKTAADFRAAGLYIEAEIAESDVVAWKRLDLYQGYN